MHTYRIPMLALLAGITILSACRKHYSCQCSTTYTKPGYYPYTGTSVEPLTEKTTRRGAKTYCDHAEKQMLKNHEDYKVGADETVAVSCAVK